MTAEQNTKRDPQVQSVLVVDDEPYIRSLLTRWLTDAGYACLEASHAEEAWATLQTFDVPVMTLDITLPGPTGLELLPEIKRSFQDTEVIMLTALGQAQTAVTALSAGASGYLIKPVAREELLFQVSRALELRQLIIDKRLYTQRLEMRVQQQTREVRMAHEETIHRLVAASRYRDEETGAHIRRVGLCSELLAQAIGWSPEDVSRIRMAAPMHDVGKIGIPDAILQKPGKLTSAEYEVMKTHAMIGAEMLAGSSSAVLQMAEQIARCHHERWDGTGYPAGLAQEAIPESARIVAIVDVFDALSHDRVYRPALPLEEVLAILEQGCGSHFDPRLVNAFVGILPKVLHVFEQMPDECDEARLPHDMQAQGTQALENLSTVATH